MKKCYLLILFLLVILAGCQSPEEPLSQNLKSVEKKDAPAVVSANKDIGPDKEESLSKIISNFYDVYNNKDFDKLAVFFAPQVKQYISLKNTTPEAIVSDAKEFFKDKDPVKYEPFLKAMEINGKNVRLGLHMSSSWIKKASGDVGYDTLTDSSVYVVVSLDFDENNKIDNYTEEYIVRPQIKLIKAQELEPVAAGDDKIKVPAGTIVSSNFQSRTFETVSWWKMYQTMVVYKGEKYWATSFTYHAADYDNTAEYYLEDSTVSLPDNYKKYFKYNYYLDKEIKDEKENYSLMVFDPDTFAPKEVYAFSNSEGDRFELGDLFGGKILEIAVIWVPSYINPRCFNVETREFLPIEHSRGVTLVGNNFYFLQFHDAPFNVHYYYGDEVDRGGYYDELLMINIKDNKIKDVYKANFGTLGIKAITDTQIVLTETLFDNAKELNYQSTPEEVNSVFLGEKDVVIPLD